MTKVNLTQTLNIQVHVDGKDATFKETSNNPSARTLAIDFTKDSRLVEIIGSQATQQ